ncbi:MAG: hypothetical protein U5J63_13000 [Fodinibius sp.]|nr:hypothetical protein [Fodinibius sp.]
MFSKAGNPWTRAVVRNVTTLPDSLKWRVTDLDNLNGSSVALQDYGVDAIDFANFVSKTKDWNQQRQLALQKMFGKQRMGDRELMVMKVSGQLVDTDGNYQSLPIMLISATAVSPNATIVMKED